jgi:hypothetical protein
VAGVRDGDVVEGQVAARADVEEQGCPGWADWMFRVAASVPWIVMVVLMVGKVAETL